MSDFVFWGGTGQAKVLAEALHPVQDRLCAIVDRQALPSPVPGVPMLLGEAGLRDFLAARPSAAGYHFAVAVGGDRGADRLALFELLQQAGMAPFTIVHARAFVARTATLGPGCQILAMASVCAEAVLERCVIVNTTASVDHDCRIGAGAHVGPGARLAGEVEVGERAFIGTGAIVLPRRRIGAGAIVGAGAVVTRDVPDNATVAGNPARPLAQR